MVAGSRDGQKPGVDQEDDRGEVHPARYVSHSFSYLFLCCTRVIVAGRYGQLQNMMKMGPIGKVMQMIPGIGQMLPQVSDDDGNIITAHLGP